MKMLRHLPDSLLRAGLNVLPVLPIIERLSFVSGRCQMLLKNVSDRMFERRYKCMGINLKRKEYLLRLCRDC